MPETIGKAMGPEASRLRPWIRATMVSSKIFATGYYRDRIHSFPSR
jgi:hypothetical protein